MHDKFCPHILFGFDINAAAVRLRDFIGNEQSQPCALMPFGRKEQTESFLPGFPIHSDAVIFNDKIDKFVVDMELCASETVDLLTAED